MKTAEQNSHFISGIALPFLLKCMWRVPRFGASFYVSETPSIEAMSDSKGGAKGGATREATDELRRITGEKTQTEVEAEREAAKGKGKRMTSATADDLLPRLKPRGGGLNGTLLKTLQVDYYVFTLELMFQVVYENINSAFQASAKFGVLRVIPFLTAVNDLLAIFAAVTFTYIEKSLITYELVANDRANEPDAIAKGAYTNAFANCAYLYITQLNAFMTRITGMAEDSFNNRTQMLYKFPSLANDVDPIGGPVDIGTIGTFDGRCLFDPQYQMFAELTLTPLELIFLMKLWLLNIDFLTARGFVIVLFWGQGRAADQVILRRYDCLHKAFAANIPLGAQNYVNQLAVQYPGLDDMIASLYRSPVIFQLYPFVNIGFADVLHKALRGDCGITRIAPMELKTAVFSTALFNRMALYITEGGFSATNPALVPVRGLITSDSQVSEEDGQNFVYLAGATLYGQATYNVAFQNFFNRSRYYCRPVTAQFEAELAQDFFTKVLQAHNNRIVSMFGQQAA